MVRLANFLAIATLTLGGGAAVAAPQQSKTPPAAKKPPPPKKAVVVSADNKKKLAERMAGFKFGMTKDEVIAVMSKKLDTDYEAKISATEDDAQKDKLRHDKKVELDRIAKSYIKFDGNKTGWDTSIIEDEFAHHTGEAMMERWENSDGKNNRRFFFFYNDKLWKMYISLDTSILPEDQRNFDKFKDLLQQQYGAGDNDPGKVTWHTDDFDVRAVDRLKMYGALGLAIEDWKVEKDVMAMRDSKAPPKNDGNAVINAVVDKDGKDHPDVKQNSDAVNAVINANGGKK
jgi:hypothetical protein|nr:hypothetical protein [Kofleriaceae bacterium]